VQVRHFDAPLNTEFKIIQDDHAWDLRGWRSARAADKVESRVVKETLFKVQKKVSGATSFVLPGTSSGTDLFLTCRSHDCKVFVPDEPRIGGEVVRYCVADVSAAKANAPITINFTATYLKNLQRDPLWVGCRCSAPSDKTTLLVAFPEDRPFPKYWLVENSLVEEPNPDKKWDVITDEKLKWLHWVIRDPKPGCRYEVHWAWPDLSNLVGEE
jgi:hypothetical protein